MMQFAKWMLLGILPLLMSCAHLERKEAAAEIEIDPIAKELRELSGQITMAEALLEAGRVNDAALILQEVEEDPKYYSEEINLLRQRIDREMRFVSLQKAKDLSSKLAVDEVEQSFVFPNTYGQSIVITPELDPLEIPKGPMEALLEKRVDLSVYDADIRTMIIALSEIDGLNIIADEALSSDLALTVNVQQVPLRELLSYISRNMGIAFHLGENVVWVTSANQPSDGTPKLQTRVFQLRQGYIPGAVESEELGGDDDGDSGFGSQNSTSSSSGSSEAQDDLLDALTAFIADNPDTPEDAKFEIYRNRNLLVMRDTRENLRAAEAIIRSFDAAPVQVMIEARFVTIGQEDLFQLGADIEELLHEELDENNIPKLNVDGRSILPPFSSDDPGGNRSLTVSGVIDEVTYRAVLRALDQTKSSRVLSSPRVTVLNNQQATIRKGRTVNYFEEFDSETTITDDQTVSTLIPSGSPAELETGLSLAVMPSIGNDHKTIILSLNAQNIEFLGFESFDVGTAEIRLPNTDDTVLSTKVVVHSGETVVMGGMIETEDLETTSKVPLLGDLPLIGTLFTSLDNNQTPSHLLVFVRAAIVDRDGRYNTVRARPRFGTP